MNQTRVLGGNQISEDKHCVLVASVGHIDLLATTNSSVLELGEAKLFAWMSTKAASKPPPTNTNVLFIGRLLMRPLTKHSWFVVVDDLRPALESYGDDGAHTPWLSSLARDGVQFNNAYCQVVSQ